MPYLWTIRETSRPRSGSGPSRPGALPGAKAAFPRIIAAYGRVPAPAFNDFMELLAYGFNIRRLYDIGH